MDPDCGSTNCPLEVKTSKGYGFSAREVVCGCPSPDARADVNYALQGMRLVRSRGSGNLKAFVFVTQIRKSRCAQRQI